MWINSNFINEIGKSLKAFSKGEYVDIDTNFKEFESDKYKEIILGLKETSNKMKRDREDIQSLLDDSSMMNKAALDGSLDVRIDTSRYNNKDFQTISNGINGTMEATVLALRDIGENLDKLSNGDFQAQITNNYDGDYKVLQIATNKLGVLLNKLIEDSNKMNQGALKGELDVRIDENQYKGDFSKITAGINGTMEATVLALRDIGENLDRLSNGDFQAQITNNYDGDYKVLQIATNALGDLLNKLIIDSNKMSEATLKSNLDERIDLAQYVGDFKKISESMNLTMEKNEQSQWIQAGVVLLNAQVLGENSLAQVSSKSMDVLCNYLNAGIGALYSFNQKTQTLNQTASYAFVQREELSNIFQLGEGTVGQVALQRSPIQLTNIKRTQLVIDTGTTSEAPLNTYTFPLIYQDELWGVIEIGSNVLFNKQTSELFELSNTIIATALATATQNKNVKELLLNAETSNVELEEQQRQLQEANSQMEEQQEQLRANTTMLKEKNDNLEKSQEELDNRAKDLELSSKYKSEFLANMSHELRTPLNSIILLSDMLHSNKSERLDEGEVKKASIIHESGSELLRLINDVLDLSKIEAGQMELIIDTFDSTALCETFQAQFEHTAKQKDLKLFIVDNYKATIVNDKDRLSQVLRNLMSNSLKFTKKGSVTLQIEETGERQVKLSVIDTGIGISEQKAHSVFEAFQQAEGGTSREYGGTGLGLSISKELASLMKGEILLESEPGKGSTFSIVIPNLDEGMEVEIPVVKVIKNQIKEPKPIVKNIKTVLVSDDRDNLTAVDSTFLIIEDDEKFAAILREKINEKNENAVIALNRKDGLELALEYNIKGVFLDLGLPDIDGIDVLKEFKANLTLRKMPVYIISGQDKEKMTKQYGTLGYIKKPITNDEIALAIDKINTFNDKKVKDLLIVKDNKNQREALIEFIGNGTIKSKGVASISTAIKELKSGIYDGVVVDFGLEDGSGYEVCEYIYKNNLRIPIIIYTSSDLTVKEEKKLRKYTDSIILKTANSQIRLLDEVDIFMHRVKVKTGVNNVNITDIDLTGKKILVVDDDIRNVYVLSEALSSKGATIITANDGKEAIEVLNKNLDTNMVLMDIMMPIMNGYEATQLIKKDATTKHIPVIAVTAKAMKEDKEKAIQSGYDDFIAKPLKMDTLIGIVKGWLEK